MLKKLYVKYDRKPQMIDPKTGLTQQSFKDECDINVLLNHWIKTGVMPSFNQAQPVYGDVSDMLSPQEAANLRIHAQEIYNDLPDDVREKYQHPMDYFEAVLAAEEVEGTMDPLDVIVPTDTNSAGKEVKDGVSEKDVQKT